MTLSWNWGGGSEGEGATGGARGRARAPSAHAPPASVLAKCTRAVCRSTLSLHTHPVTQQSVAAHALPHSANLADGDGGGPDGVVDECGELVLPPPPPLSALQPRCLTHALLHSESTAV
eukprot:1338681-Rhodomonas_salina.1